MTDRRLKAFWVAPHFFDKVVKKGHTYVSKSPLPDDAQFQGAYWIPEQGEFFVVYFSSKFREVPNGEKIPTFKNDEFQWEALE